MATKSIYKNVRIKNKSSCHKLINALEQSNKTCCERTIISKKVQTVSGDKIKEIFGNN